MKLWPYHQVAVGAHVIGAKAFIRPAAKISENEQDLSVAFWSSVEIVHGLVPDGQLGARYVVSCGPTVGLALNQNLLV